MFTWILWTFHFFFVPRFYPCCWSEQCRKLKSSSHCIFDDTRLLVAEYTTPCSEWFLFPEGELYVEAIRMRISYFIARCGHFCGHRHWPLQTFSAISFPFSFFWINFELISVPLLHAPCVLQCMFLIPGVKANIQFVKWRVTFCSLKSSCMCVMQWEWKPISVQ